MWTSTLRSSARASALSVRVLVVVSREHSVSFMFPRCRATVIGEERLRGQQWT